ncbi:site-specific integrase [Nocardia takedensis]|uniref:site-specific integrase n=1 Tax=Nocardia takedensis TaxID=259390 RepID=UPI000319F3EC|nr:tyrosine-type recombinase/integrase [Nocardia takedensis]
MPNLTPSPRRRQDGTVNWQVHYHYYDADGTRRGTAESFHDDYEEAVWWRDYVARHGLDQARLILDAKRGGSGDGTLLSTWLIDHADRSLKVGSIDAPTHRRYLGYVRNDIVPFFGETARLESVTQDTDAAWIVFLSQDKGNKAKTIKNKHGFLSSGMRAAVEQRPVPLLPFNPCSGVRLPAEHGVEHDIFDNDEWELFEELIIARWRPQAEFDLVSMARPSEVGALRVRDVHPVTGAVRITRAWKDAGSRMKLGTPKTARGTRTVNIPVQTLERLDLSRPADELLFHTRHDTPIKASYFHEKTWQPALRRLDALAQAAAAFERGETIVAKGHLTPFTKKAQWRGADPEALIAQYGTAIRTLRIKHLTPYTLRHTGISWKLQDGVPIFVVSRDAGHESVAVTDRVYGRHDRRASESAAQVIAHRLPRVRANMHALAA